MESKQAATNAARLLIRLSELGLAADLSRTQAGTNEPWDITRDISLVSAAIQ